MARRLYKVGALVEARNTKYSKGLGIIVEGPTMKRGSRWCREKCEYKEVTHFTVHWFDKPSIVSHYRQHRDNGRVLMTRNQIKIVRKR